MAILSVLMLPGRVKAIYYFEVWSTCLARELPEMHRLAHAIGMALAVR